MTNLSLGRIDQALLSRALVGFDRMFEDIQHLSGNTYPPHNIIKIDETNYEIEVAVAGFKRDEITVELNETELKITGDKVDKETSIYLYRGLASRSFVKTLHLAENIKVNDVELADGILKISLEKVIPEELKPRKLKIK
jgi:molecular chaperone IbpA